MGIDWADFQDSNRNESGKTQQAGFGQRGASPRKNGVSVEDVAARFFELCNGMVVLSSCRKVVKIGAGDGVAGRNSMPTHGIIDSQSTKTISASENRGYNGGKKIKGRKRHIVADPLGCLLAITIHIANIRLREVSFHSTFLWRRLVSQVVWGRGLEELNRGVHIPKQIKPKFEILPLRWRVERTFSRANHSRRLSKDYEIKTFHAENMFIISHFHTLMRCFWFGFPAIWAQNRWNFPKSRKIL